MPHRIEITSHIPDTRDHVTANKIRSLGFTETQIQNVEYIEVYTIDRELTAEQLQIVASMLANPVTQLFCVDAPISTQAFDWALEIGYLPGVTDNIGTTAREAIEDLLKSKFSPGEAVYSTSLLLIRGELSEKDIQHIAGQMANPLIQRTHYKDEKTYLRDNGMDCIVPRVSLHDKPTADTISLDLSDAELQELGKKGIADTQPDGTKTYRGPLALDLESMQAIKEYFQTVEQRDPTDAELETLAQTWSEHCKHTIFAASLDDIEAGLYKHYIKRATIDIRKAKGEKDICVSVFKDNSGAIIFDDEFLITDKAETHNSPSALDPFGGAITGIVGVNRDTIGFGMGAKPIINRYGFCFADPRKQFRLYRAKDKKQPALSPRQIMEGVVAGVNSGGNCSGIPSPQGFVYFDDRYAGKPLVFVGTVGLIPREINGKPGHEKKAEVGDLIVMIGGRVGKDGIHGATFSSEALDTGSPVSAVQIGDPITQKKFSDAIVKEARQLGLYHAITDDGAGGLSSSIGEMAKDTNGCRVNLDKVPLKYPGLSPWEIWISESQERMTLAVPAEKIDEFNRLMERRGVESTIIGEFTGSGRCIVEYGNEKVVNLDMTFMHDGLPHKVFTTAFTQPEPQAQQLAEPEDYAKVLTDMLGRLNCCSYAFMSHQFDHVVQGQTALQPLQGKGRVNADATITRPLIAQGFNPGLSKPSDRGIITSQALYPSYSELDPYRMAAASIDSAIRQAICVGGSLNHLALMDNFCWCSSEDPARLGQLKLAAQACYDYATAFGTPFISGKDSMFNDFKGYDENNQPVLISVPPTLLISSLGVMQDVTKAVSLEPKVSGDLVYILGATANELGGSEYLAYRETDSGVGIVPVVNAQEAIARYQALEQAINDRFVASAISIGRGGLAIALAKMSVASQLGVSVDLNKLPQFSVIASEATQSHADQTDNLRTDELLYSESQSRIIVTIDPKNQKTFEALFAGQACACIGTVTADTSLMLTKNGSEVLSTTITALDHAYKSPLAHY
ncbi:MAG TPA: AIR synthase-related protein [bacterium]|nr:AIR synthase-related protein [bacterium]